MPAVPLTQNGLTTGDWVALYAAVVATAALTWNIVRYLIEGRTRVAVQVSYGIGVGSIPDLVIIKAVNRSRHDVRVTAAGVGLQDGSDVYIPVISLPFPGYSLPFPVPAHDAGETALPVASLIGAGIDLHRPIRARVHLSTGEWIESKPTTTLPWP